LRCTTIYPFALLRSKLSQSNNTLVKVDRVMMVPVVLIVEECASANIQILLTAYSSCSVCSKWAIVLQANSTNFDDAATFGWQARAKKRYTYTLLWFCASHRIR